MSDSAPNLSGPAARGATAGSILPGVFPFTSERAAMTTPLPFTRDDVAPLIDGVSLAGWLYRPVSPGLRPAIVISHGFACVKEQGLDRFAACFAAAGFVVLAYDHRNFGASGGNPRGEIDPTRQIADLREMVTWIGLQAGVDSDRIGVWGSSYSGGHALALGAIDRRVKCVVAQVPTISGGESFRRRVAPGAVAGVRRAFAADRAARLQGAEPVRRRVIPEAGQPGLYDGPDAVAFWGAAAGLSAGRWDNAVTLRSMELASEYEPAASIARIGPTPLLMVVADDDTVTPTDLALAAYRDATEPKRLCLIPGGHFDPYDRCFAQAATAARDWFLVHLAPAVTA